MANGYGGSSGSSRSSRSSGSYSGTGELNEGFLKIKDGVEAPDGFHYMPNGKLMSDADHIAVHGYVEKQINGVTMDYSDISSKGGTKTITVVGDRGFVFSVEIYEGDMVSYYNFKTKTWTSNDYKHSMIQSVGGSTTLNVVFPSQASLKTFTVNVYAETAENIKTTHKPLVEVRNADGSVNLNKSTGSNSYCVKKVLYQDVVKNLYLSALAPESYWATTDSTDGAVSSSNRIVLDDLPATPRHVKVGDKLTCTGVASSVHALVTKINPDGDNANEIEISVTDTIGDGVAMTFTPPFNGMTPHYTDSTTGRAAFEVDSSSSSSFPFSMTITALAGRAFVLKRKPTAEDLCIVKTVTFGASALAIEGEDTSSSTYYRWPVDNIAGLVGGMFLDPSRKTSVAGNTTVPAFITNYNTTKTFQRINNDNRYYTDFEDYTVPDVSVNGIDSYNNPITTIDRNGRITAQAGNIVFNVKQADALKSDSNVKLVAQGAKAIESSIGMSVNLSNVTVTGTTQETDALLSTSATTTSAVSGSTTIPVNEVSRVVAGATLRGIGIRGTTKPIVVSKSVASGAGNIIASSAVTLEDGATVNFDGASNVITIEGTINIKNMPIVDTTLYFNVERFLTCL